LAPLLSFPPSPLSLQVFGHVVCCNFAPPRYLPLFVFLFLGTSLGWNLFLARSALDLINPLLQLLGFFFISFFFSPFDHFVHLFMLGVCHFCPVPCPPHVPLKRCPFGVQLPPPLFFLFAFPQVFYPTPGFCFGIFDVAPFPTDFLFTMADPVLTRTLTSPPLFLVFLFFPLFSFCMIWPLGSCPVSGTRAVVRQFRFLITFFSLVRMLYWTVAYVFLFPTDVFFSISPPPVFPFAPIPVVAVLLDEPPLSLFFFFTSLTSSPFSLGR